jgi:glycosyltransferase involved in cell wall biosynthesis
MLVSVVVTVRNRPQYLRECIESLLKQDFDAEQFEIIVVDDCSSDNTFEVAVEYAKRRKPPRIFAYKTEKRLGPGGARNFGNESAAGEIIVVQDSDDVSQGRRLRVIADYFAAHEDVDIFFSSAVYTNKDLKPTRSHHANISYVACLENHQLIQHPTMAYRDGVLTGSKKRTAVKYPDEMADVDYGFLLSAKKAGYKFGCVDQNLVLYRNHPEQISQADHQLQQTLAHQKRQATRQQNAGFGISNFARKQATRAKRRH